MKLTATLVTAFSGLVALSAAAAALPLSSSEPGTSLVVESLRWQLEGPFAQRHIELRIKNPGTQTLETTVQLPLATHERLETYALDIEGQFRQAVPVPKVKARAVFEDTVRRQVDPALAEKGTGNSYSIRVFPVPAGGERRVRLTIAGLAERTDCGWLHQLGSGLAAGTKLKAEVTVAGASPDALKTSLKFRKKADQLQASWAAVAGASADVCIAAPQGDSSFSQSFADGLQMHWLELPALHTATAPKKPSQHIEVVWDLSLSSAQQSRQAELELLAAYLKNRSLTLTLSLLRNDLQREQLKINTAADIQALIQRLAAEPADGATNLAPWTAAAQADEVLMFSDLLNTMPAELLPVVSQRLYAISSAQTDPALAAWLTRSGGQIIDLSRQSVTEALKKLTELPALQISLSPGDLSWYSQSYTPQQGAVRACYITRTTGAAAIALPVLHAASTEAQLHQLRPGQSNSKMAFWCASWWAESLAVHGAKHSTELAELGSRFGIATAQSSLLVLESEQDYLQHAIVPPDAEPALRYKVLQQAELLAQQKAAQAVSQRAAIEAGWQERIKWWQTSFPKTAPEAPKRQAKEQREEALVLAERQQAERSAAAERVEVMATRQRRLSSEEAVQPMAVAAAPPPASAQAEPQPIGAATVAMQLQAVSMESPYLTELKLASSAQALYLRYLDLRTAYAQSPAFYFDVAQRLYELADAKMAERVLTNLVELMPEQHATLRLVAYRLQEAGNLQLAQALLRKVLQLAPDEPQSYRDLALALTSETQCQEALTLLQHVVDSAWHERFAEIGLIALGEYHDRASRCSNANPSGWSSIMLTPLPVDMRVVLSWDLNDTDIDLHVIDPNGEEAFYDHRTTYQGGFMSKDFTGGYGPEEFILRAPKAGEYQVLVKYYGSQLARLSRGVMLNLKLQTGFGSQKMQQQSISMRLLEKTDKVLVGSFTVTASGQLQLGTH